jgi:molybdenum cofactor cytidylyltransferase
MISAIVVAAGKSSRMGDIDKLNLEFENSTILGTVLKNLNASMANEIILVASDPPSIPENLSESNIKTVINPSPEDGLTSSIQIGVKNANPVYAYLVCLADMPLINTDEYNRLIKSYLEYSEKVIIQPFDGVKPGNPVLFSNHFRKDILNTKENTGCRPVVMANPIFLKRLKTTSASYFTDIDTLAQYKKIINNHN